LLEGHAASEAMAIVSLRDGCDRARVYLAEPNPEAAFRIASTARLQIAKHPDRQALVSWEDSLAEIEAEADVALGKIASARDLFGEVIRRRSARLDPNSPEIVESPLGAAEDAGKLGRVDDRKQFCAGAKGVIFGVPLGEHDSRRFARACASGGL
jgi:hypothetical protein